MATSAASPSAGTAPAAPSSSKSLSPAPLSLSQHGLGTMSASSPFPSPSASATTPTTQPSSLARLSLSDKLLLAQAVHHLGATPPNWGEVSSLMLNHPLVKTPARIESASRAGLTLGRVFGSRECERAWTALMRLYGLVIPPSEGEDESSAIGSYGFTSGGTARTKEARGLPPRLDKASQLALAKLLYAERMQEIFDRIKEKEEKFKSLVKEIDDLKSGAHDAELEKELKTLNAAPSLGLSSTVSTRAAAAAASSSGSPPASGAAQTTPGTPGPRSLRRRSSVQIDGGLPPPAGDESAAPRERTKTSGTAGSETVQEDVEGEISAGGQAGEKVAESGVTQEEAADGKNALAPAEAAASRDIEKAAGVEEAEDGPDPAPEARSENGMDVDGQEAPTQAGATEEESDARRTEATIAEAEEASSSRRAKRKRDEASTAEEGADNDSAVNGDEEEGPSRPTLAKKRTRSNAGDLGEGADDEEAAEVWYGRSKKRTRSGAHSKSSSIGKMPVPREEKQEEEGEDDDDAAKEGAEDDAPRRTRRSGRTGTAQGENQPPSTPATPALGRMRKGRRSRETTGDLSVGTGGEEEERGASPVGDDSRSTVGPEEDDSPAASRRTSKASTSAAAAASASTRKTRGRGRDGASADREASTPAPTSATTKAKKKNEKVLLMLLSEVSNHTHGNLFHNAIKEQDAPDYYTLIRHPLDLKTIRARIKEGRITTVTQLKRSLNLMFANSLIYNRPGTAVHTMALQMREAGEEALRRFETTQRRL